MLVEYVTRGVTAGLVAGLVFGLFVVLVANPLVVYADDLAHGSEDETLSDAHGPSGEQPARTLVAVTASNAVSVLSAVLWGVLLGAVVFGVEYYFLEPALPGGTATKNAVLAVAGFATVSGAPWLVLPPHPPGVDQALSPRTRIALYGGMMVLGAVVSLLAVYAYGRVRPARGRAVATVVAVAAFGLLVIPTLLVPANTVESGLAPHLATGLVGTIVFGQGLLWASLAIAHAHLLDRSKNRSVSDLASVQSETDARAD